MESKSNFELNRRQMGNTISELGPPEGKKERTAEGLKGSQKGLR